MDKNNRPGGREVHHVNGTGSVNKRGSGLGTGPVGSTGGNARKNTGSYGRPSDGQPVRMTRGKSKLGGLIGVAVVAVFLISRLGGSGGSSIVDQPSQVVQTSSALSSISTIMNLLPSTDYNVTSTDYSSFVTGSSTSKPVLDTTVAEGSREKRTEILGKGKDTVTIMVYMCGTDLESKSGMASSDLSEMCAATISDNINLIVYTGGCNAWKTSGISNRVNQIYQIKKGRMTCLEDDMGAHPMTDPDTLTEFIKYCTGNFPANRQELIFWDHGGGSISGYGYDEKYKSGSMTLSGIDKALKNAGTTFDFIGFDACLMATVENGLMLADYADYMIASEETEPGVGWYYTNWLTRLSDNTSMATVEIGKNIVDDFVDVCNKKCNGQKTTLSVVDLAELETTVPESLTAFASSTKDMIANDEYRTVSDARYNTKEFAQSSKIDQIDLVHFAKNLNTVESRELAEDLCGAVKYNRTASCVSDAYGLSIYFPYKKANKVDQMVNTYNSIGMDSEYARCIQEFASLEVCGQAANNGSSSAFQSLTGAQVQSTGTDALSSLFTSILSGSSYYLGGFDTSAFDFLSGSGITSGKATEYITNNYFDASNLVWTTNASGETVMKLSEEQWGLVEGLDLNVFYDDGEGYIDLGLDNVLEYDDDGNLLGKYDGSWLSINGQVVAYYHTDRTRTSDGVIDSGYIPVILNGDRAELIVVFDTDHPYGYITGARYVYTDGNETVAKDIIGLCKGDKIDFICDYYNYTCDYNDTYYLGDTMVLGDTLEIGNILITDSERLSATYCFTDIYQQKFWTPVIP